MNIPLKDNTGPKQTTSTTSLQPPLWTTSVMPQWVTDSCWNAWNTYLEDALQTCSRADLCSRLSWWLYTKSRAVMTLSLFWALSASTWGSGPQLTSFVLHSSNLRSALSVREHGARLIGWNNKCNSLLNQHIRNTKEKERHNIRRWSSYITYYVVDCSLFMTEWWTWYTLCFRSWVSSVDDWLWIYWHFYFLYFLIQMVTAQTKHGTFKMTAWYATITLLQ